MDSESERNGDLLPCPFCGGAAFITHVEAHDHSPMLKRLIPDLEPASETFWPQCACGAAKQGCDTEAEAIFAWNTRASTNATIGWEPIETAPRDGTLILVFHRDAKKWPFIVHWKNGHWSQGAGRPGWNEHAFTAWHRVSPPPTIAPTGGGER